MRISVGLLEHRASIGVTLEGDFRDASGAVWPAGGHRLEKPVLLTPLAPGSATFALDDVTIGVGFHWERRSRQTFRGALRLVGEPGRLTAINDVDLETYIECVIASEMSGRSPLEFLKAHAIISRSWLVAALGQEPGSGTHREERQTGSGEWEIRAWYGREAHAGFDVCADDHCQRYQGIPLEGNDRGVAAAAATRGRFLLFGDDVCDARFSKCCGGVTEDYRAAWDDREVPYLQPVFDGEGATPVIGESWFTASPDVWCNRGGRDLIDRVLPGFDLETADFFRWTIRCDRSALGELVQRRTGLDLGPIAGLEALERARSGRIVRLRIRGERGTVRVGKELEVRRVLSPSHLYSSAFWSGRDGEAIVLKGAGWGHGVGLCQIGAAAMADEGLSADDILGHYYPGTRTGPLPKG